MKDQVNIMLELLQTAVLNRTVDIQLDSKVDWNALMDQSVEQGLLAWVWDGISMLPPEQQPPRQQRINWALSAQEVWDSYAHRKAVLHDMVAICKANNVRMLVLKGLGISALYPKPESRLSGDIDIFLFGDAEKGNRILSPDGDASLHEKHYVFYRDEVQVENHVHLIDMGTPLQRRIEDYLISTLDDSLQTVDGYYVLDREPLIIYTLMHLLAHLNNPGDDPLQLRSIVDFAMLLRQYDAQRFPSQLLPIIRRYNLEMSFSLFVALSEWILNVSFADYKIDGCRVEEDFEDACRLILDDNIRHPFFYNCPKNKHLDARWKYYRQIRWRYRYLPTMKGKRLRLFVNEFLHSSIKSLLGLPTDLSFSDGVSLKLRNRQS